MVHRGMLMIGLMGSLPLVCGCERAYVAGYSYYPQPATVEVRRQGDDRQLPLAVLVSVLGVHNADAKKNIPYSVIVRMRFENVGQSHVLFDPRSLDLVTGTLRAFPQPLVRPPQAFDLAPGQRQELTAYFPFPPNTTAWQMNLRNLRLRWEVTIEGTRVLQAAVFEQVEPGYQEDSDQYY